MIVVWFYPFCAGVADDDPLVRLPDEVVLARDEVATVLFGVDVLETVAFPSADAARVEGAAQLLISNLRPDLGDLLDGDRYP